MSQQTYVNKLSSIVSFAPKATIASMFFMLICKGSWNGHISHMSGPCFCSSDTLTKLASPPANTLDNLTGWEGKTLKTHVKEFLFLLKFLNTVSIPVSITSYNINFNKQIP